ncbi:MAG: ABC-F family ATP-binding cassette domain-containing protein [Actinomycetota bacterium]|nr:ABC-F family ATP-binding cassette domain-containing protein [Actinomycetota bacterium]
MLSARGIGFSRDGEVVLDGVSLSVGPGSRLGVVGPNGIGKTTLLRILAGELEAERGSVERAPASLAVGLFTQEPDTRPGETLAGYLARRTGVEAAGSELDRLTARLAEDPEALDAYSEALERFIALGGGDFEARAAAACAEVGLPPERMGAAVAELSGGQGARARLAAVLLARFDVLLLDEPTNDLDFEGLELLEGFLGSLPGAVVTVSHDRAFLDRAVTRVLEIEEHTHRGVEYAGAWSEYVERRALARSQAGAAHEAWLAERRRLQERIRTQRAWSEEGARKAARKPKDKDRAQQGWRVNRTEKQASKVRRSEKALSRLGTLEKPWEGWDLRLELSPAARSGELVSALDAAVLRRGDWSLGPVDLELHWADRMAITGPNGGGKSTLMALLTGRLAPDEGRARVGPSVIFGELDQRRAQPAPGASLLEAFVALTGAGVEESRSTLAKFGLTARELRRAWGGLSPGERTRARLAALVLAGTNCLVLDEPTNHLDLPAIEQLEAALGEYPGTLLVVTHDRWLLEVVSFGRAVRVADGKVEELEGP